MCREDNLCYIYTVNWDACQCRIIRLQVIGNSAQTGWNNIITVTLTFPNEEMASKSTPFSESKAGSYFTVHRRADIVDLEALIALSNSIAQSRGTSLDVSWTRLSWCNQCWFSCSVWLCLSTYVGLFSWLPGGYSSFKSNMFTAPNTVELACSNVVRPNEWLWSCYLYISQPITISRESPWNMGYAISFLPVWPIPWASIYWGSACFLLGAGNGV